MPRHLAPAAPPPSAAAFVRVLLPLLAALAWLAALLGAGPAAAQAPQPVPALSARVIDRSATLDAQQLQALEAKLAAFEAERGSQIVVLLVPTTAPEDIAAYAYRVADTWKVGRREIGDGILLVVAKNDRQVRIEVARALEGAIPDLAAYRIIDRLITPAFRRGDFAGGLEAGVDGLMAHIRGEALPLPEAGAAFELDDLGAFLFAVVPVLGSVLISVFGRKLGALATAGVAGFVAKLVTGSFLLAILAAVLALLFVLALGVGGAGRRGGPVIWGGGHGRGGGGGFRSGGGGSFGGGGASGRW